MQTHSVVRESYRAGRETGRRVLAANLPAAPNNVGPKTIPDYAKVAAEAEKGLKGGGRVFAGQADDPFFVSAPRSTPSTSARAPARRVAVGTIWRSSCAGPTAAATSPRCTGRWRCSRTRHRAPRHVGHGAGVYAPSADVAELAVCERCGARTTLDPRFAQRLREAVEAAVGFVPRFDHTPLAGLCGRCAERRGTRADPAATPHHP